MTDKQFIEEVRARTGEPVLLIGKTIWFIYQSTESKCFYPINYVYDHVINILETDYSCSSMNAAKSMFIAELSNS